MKHLLLSCLLLTTSLTASAQQPAPAPARPTPPKTKPLTEAQGKTIGRKLVKKSKPYEDTAPVRLQKMK